MQQPETTPLESAGSTSDPPADSRFPVWFKMGAIAAASALAGGLAAAWFYRKILNTLRQAESNPPTSDSGIFDDEPEDF